VEAVVSQVEASHVCPLHYVTSILVPSLDNVWLTQRDDFVSHFFERDESGLEVERAHQVNSAPIERWEHRNLEGRSEQRDTIVVHAIGNLALKRAATVEDSNVRLFHLERLKYIKGSEVENVIFVLVVNRLLVGHVDLLHLTVEIGNLDFGRTRLAQSDLAQVSVFLVEEL